MADDPCRCCRRSKRYKNEEKKPGLKPRKRFLIPGAPPPGSTCCPNWSLRTGTLSGLVSPCNVLNGSYGFTPDDPDPCVLWPDCSAAWNNPLLVTENHVRWDPVDARYEALFDDGSGTVLSFHLPGVAQNGTPTGVWTLDSASYGFGCGASVAAFVTS